jgi:hypothetical protein
MIKKIVLIILLFAQSALATDYFIDQSGNGDGDGSSYANRMSMANYISGNLDASLDPGDTIYLCGTITTEFDTRESGSSGNQITLNGDCSTQGGTDATINGTANGVHLTADDYWTIYRVTVTNFTGRGIYATNSDGVIVQECTISGGNDSAPDHGIQIQGTADPLETGVQVIDNTIGTINSSENDTVSFNGIIVQGTNGAIIARNDVNTTNTVGIRHILGGTSDNTNSEINDNDIHGCYGGLLMSNTDSGKIHNNTIRDGKGVGIGVAYDSDDAEIYNNLIYNIATQSTNLWNGIDINHDSQDGVVYNNTVYKVHGNCIVLDDATAACDGWLIKNNIFDARENGSHTGVEEYPFRCNGDAISFTSDYNILYPHTDQGGDVFYDGDDDTASFTLAEVQNGDPETGAQEANSDDSDPLFRSTTDFHLQSGSPAIDTGTDVGLSICGSGPDMGRYENDCGFGVGTSSIGAGGTNSIGVE